MKKQTPPSDSEPITKAPPSRYAVKGVGRDRTNPRTHKYKAQGGPIERRWVKGAVKMGVDNLDGE